MTSTIPTTDRAAPRVAPLPAGTRVAGRYRVRRFVADGATSHVYEAEDEFESKRIALKVVARARDDAGRALEAFEVEAAAYARIDSPHVPKLYRVGTLRDGSRFMVLELLQGRPLSERLAQGPLALPAVLELGRQLLSALHAVHSAGLVHCDVKPQNILAEAEPPSPTWIRLVDFGIAVAVRKDCVAPAAPASTVVGTPEYMSPEQAGGEPIDPRSDVYSAGVVLYQALTGRLPIAAASDRELMLAKLRDPIVPPRALRESCPIELERALMRALSRSRQYRYSAAQRLVDELAWIRDRHSLGSGWALPPSAYPPAPPSAPEAITRRAPGVTRHRGGSTG